MNDQPTRTTSETSEALHFLRASYNVAALNPDACEARKELDNLIIAAIRTRMEFRPGDGAEPQRLADRGEVRGFAPLHKRFYTQACIAGSSYVEMWEKANART